MSRSATTVTRAPQRSDAPDERRRSVLLDERRSDRERDERRAERIAARAARHPADRREERDRIARLARETERASADRPPARDRPVADRAPAPVRGEVWAYLMEPPPERGTPGRHTVTISGQGAEGYETRHGTRASSAQRYQAIRRHERAGFRPDRVAMWAVMLGVMLMLAAAASSHAAVLAHQLH